MNVWLRCSLVLAGLVAACGGAGRGPEPAVDDLPRLAVEEDLRIGSVDDPDVGFSAIAGVVVDERGDVYVLDRQECTVRVYDSEGRRQRTFGGQGSGPGEFRRPTAIGLIGDTVWVSDGMRRQVSLFRPTGEFVRLIRSPMVLVQTVPLMMQVIGGGPRPDGWLDMGDLMMAASTEMTDDTFPMPHVRMDTTGTLDTLWLQPFAFSRPHYVHIADRRFVVPRPPESGRLWVEAGDDVYVIDRPVAGSAAPAEFAVTLLARQDTLFHRTYRYTPRAFDGAATDARIAESVERYARQGDVNADGLAAMFRDAFEAPAFHPPVSSGWAAPDGQLLLRREDLGGTSYEWILLRPDGEPVGRFELPRRATLHWMRGATLWVDVRDEYDLPWLVRYRIGD